MVRGLFRDSGIKSVVPHGGRASRVYSSEFRRQMSMRLVAGVIRYYVMTPVCWATEEAGGGGVKGGRCWSEPFVVDIRYDTTTEQVCLFLCLASRIGWCYIRFW